MLTTLDGRRFQWQFEDGPSRRYQLGISVCANPFCSCDVLNVEFADSVGDGAVPRAIDFGRNEPCPC